MLKSCWDCILGDSREQANEVIYGNGTQLNADSHRAPPWPATVNENEIMFLLPRKLQINDKIHIDGILRSEPQSFIIRLITGNGSPDYSNIAFELAASFSEDRFTTKIVENGIQTIFPVNLTPSQIIGSTGFSINTTITVTDDVQNPIIEVNVGVSAVTQVELKHDLEDIRFLSLDGDVAKVGKLQFDFS